MPATSPATASSALPLGRQSWVIQLTTVLLASAVLTLSAKVKVPFYPVDMTMQPLAVLGLGLLLGSRLAVATVLVYLAQGAAGLPVFTGTPEKGIGLAYMMGPTAGYLVGFVLAAAATGWAADRGWTRGLVGALGASAVGLVLIYTPGVAYLASLLGFEKAVQFGLAPFWLKDVVAAVLAAVASTAVLAAARR
ncbi:MAG: biotin transporter BioY [Pseudomonadota bacterium]